MAKEKKGEGIRTAAGLVRYFDTEESAVKVDPKIIMGVSVVVGVVILVLTWLLPL